LKIPNPTYADAVASKMNCAAQVPQWMEAAFDQLGAEQACAAGELPGNSPETDRAHQWAQQACAAETNTEVSNEETSRAQIRVQQRAHTAQPIKSKPVARRKQKKAKRVRKPVSGSALAAGQVASSSNGNNEQCHPEHQRQGEQSHFAGAKLGHSPDGQKSHDLGYESEDTNFDCDELT